VDGAGCGVGGDDGGAIRGECFRAGDAVGGGADEVCVDCVDSFAVGVWDGCESGGERVVGAARGLPARAGAVVAGDGEEAGEAVGGVDVFFNDVEGEVVGAGEGPDDQGDEHGGFEGGRIGQ